MINDAELKVTLQDRMREKVFRDNSEVLNHDQ